MLQSIMHAYHFLSIQNVQLILYVPFSYSVFGSFALQTILSTIFGCTANILGDAEWKELNECVHTYVEGYKEGEFEKFVLLHSKTA